jgi:uncharacterized protein GlcG (DUF336 family)
MNAESGVFAAKLTHARRDDKTETTMPALTLDDANRILAAALGAAREMGIPPVTVVVLDDAGQLKAVQREDGASAFRFDVALGKAFGAVGMGVASRVLADRAQENPNFFVALSSTANGRFLPQPGAVLVRDGNGEIIGAVGASGGTGDEDEAICARGVGEAGFNTD